MTRLETTAIIKRNAWEYARRLYRQAHPPLTEPQMLARYVERHQRFTQDLWWFPETLFLGTVRRH